jgi:hypothetical protein
MEELLKAQPELAKLKLSKTLLKDAEFTVLYLMLQTVLISWPCKNSLKVSPLLEPGAALMNSTELTLKYSLLLPSKL